MRAFVAQHLILVLPAYIHKTTHYGAEHFYRRTAPVYAHVVLAVCGAEICDSIKVTSDTVRLGYLYTPLRMPAGTSHHGG